MSTDVSTSADAMDAATSMDTTPSIDASTEDRSTPTMDGPGVLDGRSDLSDVASGDGESGVPPAPTDAASEDASGPASTDAAADSGEAAPTPDSSGDDANDADSVADIAGDVTPTPDATSDGADVADGGPDAIASGFPGSTLVDSTEGAMINGWVGTPAQLWKLCYSTALHTRSGATFHANCDYKGPSVSIARVTYSTETRIIGGYNSGSWTSPAMGTYSPFSGSFLFSVTNAFKHEYPGSSTVPYYVFNNQYYGPTFGAGNDWYVHSQMTMGTCRPGYTYACRVGTVDTTTCNVDFCGTPTSSDYYALEALEVWVK